MRRFITAFIVLTLGLFLVAGSCARPAPTPVEKFPESDITWIVPFTVGGGFDVPSRALAVPMAKDLGVNIVINNVTGAGGRTGAIALYRAQPDGYTIGILNITGLIAEELTQNVTDYNTEKFVYLGLISDDTWGLMVPTNSPFKSIEDLRQATKPIRVGVTGAGSAGYNTTVIASEVLKIPIQLVTGYEGLPQATLDLQRGNLDGLYLTYDAHGAKGLKEGNYKCLVQLRHQRHELAPDAPTADEIGHPELVDATVILRPLAAPPGTPNGRAQILEAALMKAMGDPEILKWSKETERPLSALGGAEVRKVVSSARETLAKYKYVFEKYAAK